MEIPYSGRMFWFELILLLVFVSIVLGNYDPVGGGFRPSEEDGGKPINFFMFVMGIPVLLLLLAREIYVLFVLKPKLIISDTGIWDQICNYDLGYIKKEEIAQLEIYRNIVFDYIVINTSKKKLIQVGRLVLSNEAIRKLKTVCSKVTVKSANF